MKRVLINKDNNILFEYKDAKEIHRILNADIHSVTEEDEIRYEHIFRPLIGKDLTYEVHFNLKFKGIDDWHRPVFKDIDTKLYFGDVDKLWSWDTPKNKIIEYYKENLNALEYFGSSFGCEPHGGKQDFFKFKITDL